MPYPSASLVADGRTVPELLSALRVPPDSVTRAKLMASAQLPQYLKLASQLLQYGEV